MLDKPCPCAASLTMRPHCRKTAISLIDQIGPILSECPWPGYISYQPTTRFRLSSAKQSIDMLALFKVTVRGREYVSLSGDPNIQGRQQEDAHYQVSDQPAHDDDRKGALRVGTDGV